VLRERRLQTHAAALEAAITPADAMADPEHASNPTGAAYDRGELEALGEVLLHHPHVMVLSDDIYDQIWFRDEPMTTLAAAVPALKDRILLTNGVSKSYAMTAAHRLCGRSGRVGSRPSTSCSPDVVLSIVDQPGRRSTRACRRADFVGESVKLYRERRDYACARAERRASPALPGAGRCVLSLSELRGYHRQGHSGREDDQ